MGEEVATHVAQEDAKPKQKGKKQGSKKQAGEKQAKKKQDGAVKRKRVRRTKEADEPRAAKKPEKKPAPSVQQVLERILPVLSVAIAFVAVVLLYRKLMPPPVEQGVDEPKAATVQDAQVAASSSNTEAYTGVEDRWTPEGVFMSGDKELDEQVKAFCDALTVEGAAVGDNARTAYNKIIWSNFAERSVSETPTGSTWAIAAARHYFSSGNPAAGEGGSGDVYDFAAATCYCLRYFGFYDAIAVPVLRGTAESGQSSSALVLVSDENGIGRVCDPTLAGDGWMLDRDLYDIVVEDIGQDLTQVESMGLYVQKNTDGEIQQQT